MSNSQRTRLVQGVARCRGKARHAPTSSAHRARRTIVFTLLTAAAILLLVACTEDGRPPVPTPTATATALPTETPFPPTATPNIVGLSVQESGKLTKYRYTLDITGTGVEADAHFIGEYHGGHQGIISGTVGGIPTEQFIVDDFIFLRDKEGEWVRRSSLQRTPVPGSENQVISVDNLTANPHPLRAFGLLVESSKDLSDQGEEIMNGVRVRKVSYRLDPERFYAGGYEELKAQMGGSIPDFGGGTVWHDPATKFVHKFTVTVDLARFAAITNALETLFDPTPTPGGPSPTPIPPGSLTITLTATNHNDPNMVIPSPPPTATPVFAPLFTPTPASP